MLENFHANVLKFDENENGCSNNNLENKSLKKIDLFCANS